MSALLNLEIFDGATDGDLSHAGKTAAPATYEEGYTDGLAAAEAAFQAQQSTLQNDLVQSIETAAFGYHEAQGAMIAAVQPLLESMLSTLLPAVLAPALHAHLRDMIDVALKEDLTVPIRLAVPPDQLEAVQVALGHTDVPQLKLTSDPDLQTHAAWICLDGTETALDLDGALAAIGAHIASLQTILEQPREVS